MKNAFLLALKDIKKNLIFILILYLQIIISIVVIAMSLFELPQILSLRNHISILEQNNVVTFKSYYKASQRIADMPQSVRNILVDEFDNKKIAFSTTEAYSFDQYPDKPVLIAVGNFSKLYPIGVKVPVSEPQAYIGSNIKDIPIGDALKFGGNTTVSVKVVGRLLPNSSYCYRTFEKSLNDSIVIVTPYQVLPKLFGTFFDEELIQNANFINPSKEEITKYVQTINTSKIINVLPYSASKLYGENYKTELFNQFFFLIFFVIAFVFNLIGVIANLMNTINKNLKAFAVHYMYGSTRENILERIVFYILLVLMPPIFIAFCFLDFARLFKNLGINVPQLYFVFFVFVSAAIVSIYPIKKLHTTDLPSLIRRD